MFPRLYPISETTMTIEWGYRIDPGLHQQVLSLNHALLQAPFPGFLETVPTYSALTVYYAPERIAREHPEPGQFVKNLLEERIHQSSGLWSRPGNLVHIPVCYDDDFGLDLEELALVHGISKEILIQLHQETEYRVYMMGFLPGFAYLGTLKDAIATPRKPSPRPRVEAGSVGIAGNQTGIYPVASPGGWQIIGRTPYRLFDPGKTNPFLLQTGDTVRFQAISREKFEQIKAQQPSVSRQTPAQETADVRVLHPGVYSSLQCLGSPGFQAFGVPLGGSMDPISHQIANALVGNPPEATTLEATLGGLKLEFAQNTVIALTGGGAAFLNGEKISFYQARTVAKKDVLSIRYTPTGIRTYLAVQGGFAAEHWMDRKSVPPVMGLGTALKKDDCLQIHQRPSRNPGTLPGIELKFPPPIHPDRIRVFAGPEHDWMNDLSRQQLFTQKFSLSHRCDRMGFHFQAAPLVLSSPRELLSAAVTKGVLQLTPGGQLIALMNDCQTTGGYPRVGQIAAVDLPRLAQMTPGATITFQQITFAEAEALYLQQQQSIHALFS